MIIALIGVVTDGSMPDAGIKPASPFAQKVTVPRGEALTIRLTVKKQDHTAYDLTGLTVSVGVRERSSDAAPVLVHPVEDIPAGAEATAGKVDVVIDDVELVPLISRFQHVFDVWLVEPGGNWQIVPVSPFLIADLAHIPGEEPAPPGAAVPASAAWRSGSGEPLAGLGNDGDFYIDLDADAYYGPKADGDWGEPTSLIGDDGPPGADGAAGASTLHSGTGAPSSGLGTDGEFYVRTDTTQLYGPKTAGAWGSPTNLIGPPGPAGADGRTILSGTTNPGAGTGANGDFYLRTDTSVLFGPKASGSWPAGVSLVGPQGPAGADGAPGADGDDGAPGADGDDGAPGADGKTWHSGSGAPGGGVGVDGDFYLDTAASAWYGPKTAGVWGSPTSLIGPQGVQGIQGIQGIQGVQGVQGPPGPDGSDGAPGADGADGDDGAPGADGADGKTWHSGSGAPGGGVGVDGDFYLDTAASAWYGPKTAGAWGSAHPLIGPQGPAGDPGPAGADGEDGAPGATGPEGPEGPAGPAGADGEDFPNDAQIVVSDTHASLPAARVATTTSTIAVDVATANVIRWNITNGAVGTTQLADGSVTYAKMQATSAGNVVLGRATNTGGAVAEIAASTDGHVLRLAGTTLGFGTLASGAFANHTISGACLAGFTVDRIPIGVSGGGLGDSTLTLASNTLTHAASSSGGTVSAVVSNTSTNASSKALIQTVVAGGTADDAVYQAVVNGVTTWTWGADNSDSDAWVLAASSALGTSNRVKVTTGGAATFTLGTAGSQVVINSTQSSTTVFPLQIVASTGRAVNIGVGESGVAGFFGLAGGAAHFVTTANAFGIAIGTRDTSAPINFGTSDTLRLQVTGLGSIVIGTAALATSATDGFLYIPTTPGAPTGAATSFAGRVPLDYDDTNHRLYARSGGTWRSVALN